MSTNGGLLFALIGTLVVLAAPVITGVFGLYVGGITILAGIAIVVLWKD